MNTMNIALLILIAFFLGLYACAIWSRVNGIEYTDDDEPLGDMVDIRAIISKYED